MNSMFSSFDALCAEFLGQKVLSSFAMKTAATDDKVSTMKKQEREEGIGCNSSATTTTSVQEQAKNKKKVPRFAPELDGLNCFETLVRY